MTLKERTKPNDLLIIGATPIARESGCHKGKRFTQGGRSQIQTVLCMTMISAIQCIPVFKVTYTRFIQ
ncbi:transposase [Vibrio nigripulchritudo]|uniref:transposase n=1 Tax=Vibrio nigripulchritudo TaxID=28173 RepID=UPI0009B8F562